MEILELGSVEAGRAGILARTRKKVSGLIDHRHLLRRELRHAGSHQMNDATHLGSIEGAPRVKADENGCAGLLVLPQEDRRSGNGQMHPGILHFPQGPDGLAESSL